jgi:hypothetical protein
MGGIFALKTVGRENINPAQNFHLRLGRVAVMQPGRRNTLKNRAVPERSGKYFPYRILQSFK